MNAAALASRLRLCANGSGARRRTPISITCWGEEPKKPGKGATEDRNALAAKHLEQICRAVLNGDDILAEKLASANR
jgi:hypothetical protein